MRENFAKMENKTMKNGFFAYKKLSCRDLYDPEMCNIVLLRKGFLSIFIDGVEHLFAAPSVIALGDGLDVGAVSGYRHEKYTVRFTREYLFPACKDKKSWSENEEAFCLVPLSPFDKQEKYGRAVSEADMELLYSALSAAGSVKGEDRDAVISSLVPALELLYRIFEERPLPSSRASENCVELAQADIYRNYRDKISLVTVSRTVKVNKTTVARAFREKTGLSVSDCIIAYRIRLADMLLSMSELTVSKTAALCGFNSEAYFVKQYGARKGITPAQFRKKLRGGN